MKQCVTKPGPKLDNSEQQCLTKCMDRYTDVFALVQRQMARQQQAAQNQAPGSF